MMETKERKSLITIMYILAVVAAFMIEIYYMINDPYDVLTIIGIGIILIITLYLSIEGIVYHIKKELSAKEEQTILMVKAQKAVYLVNKKLLLENERLNKELIKEHERITRKYTIRANNSNNINSETAILLQEVIELNKELNKKMELLKKEDIRINDVNDLTEINNMVSEEDNYLIDENVETEEFKIDKDNEILEEDNESLEEVDEFSEYKMLNEEANISEEPELSEEVSNIEEPEVSEEASTIEEPEVSEEDDGIDHDELEELQELQKMFSTN